jgi:hypothetical protein
MFESSRAHHILLASVVAVFLISVGARAQLKDAQADPNLSGGFHLSETQPTNRLVLSGEKALVKIRNIGPASLVVVNSMNNVTLGANSTFELRFDGDTTLSIDRSESSHQTDGTFEVNPIEPGARSHGLIHRCVNAITRRQAENYIGFV